MQNGKIVSDIQFYNCGYCINNLNFISKKLPFERKKFYARAISFKHDEKYYLFDTGYSRKIFQNGISSRLYNLLNPAFVEQKDEIIEQLKIDISAVFISHLHPDHIGGLHFFPHQKVILSKKSYELLDSKNPLVFKNLLPQNLKERTHILHDERCDFLHEFFDEVYDFFGDGSVYLIALEGHMSGQYGIFFAEHKLFCIADATWDLSYPERQMRLFARFVQSDYKQYVNTIDRIRKFKDTGIKIVTSH